MGSNKIPFWRKSDADACVGVFFDGFTKVIAGVGILTGVIGFTNQRVFQNIMPGIGFAVLLYGIYLWWEGRRLAKAKGDPDTVAIPGGLVAGRFFVWLFSIMGPTYWVTQDAELAWQVGIWAQMLGGVVFIISGLVAPWLLKIIPRGALFGAMAGGALCWLFLAPIGDLFTKTIVGFVSLFIVLVFYLGKFNLKIPTAILAILVGTAIAWILYFLGYPELGIDAKNVQDSFSNLGFNLPKLYFGFLNMEALQYTLSHFMPIIIVFSFGEVISAIQAVGQAESGGDVYDSRRIILGTAFVSMLSGFFGNPFPMGTYWGHVGWKKIKAGTGYMLGVGALYFILTLTGVVAIATSAIPVESTLPTLIFIALASMAQSFEEAGDKKYFPAVALAMAIPVVEFVWGKITAAAGLLEGWTLPMLAEKGIAPGYQALSQGASFTGIIMGAILCFVIDNKWRGAAIASFTGAALSFVGIINSSEIRLFANNTYSLLYVALGVFFLVLHVLKVDNTKSELN